MHAEKLSWVSKRTLKLAVLGAISFWLPDTLWHALKGYRFGGQDALVLTFLMPISFFTYFWFIRKQSAKPARWPFVVAVWLLGGPFMAAGASFSGGGFAGPGGISDGLKLILITTFPVFAIDFATYDGSLGALFIVSVMPVLLWAWPAIARKFTRPNAVDGRD